MQPFVTLFQGRSGSKFLNELLSLGGGVVAHAEVFHEAKTRYKDDEAVRRKLRELWSVEAEACGFQYRFPRHFNECPEIVRWLHKQADEVKVIFLYRSNFLKAAISQENVINVKRNYGRSHLYSDDEVQNDKVFVDIDKVVDQTLKREKLHDHYLAWATSNFDCFILKYEDLCADWKSIIPLIFQFLGVPKVGIEERLESYVPKLTKILSDDLSETIYNYPRLVEKCNEAGIEGYLDV